MQTASLILTALGVSLGVFIAFVILMIVMFIIYIKVVASGKSALLTLDRDGVLRRRLIKPDDNGLLKVKNAKTKEIQEYQTAKETRFMVEWPAFGPAWLRERIYASLHEQNRKESIPITVSPSRSPLPLTAKGLHVVSDESVLRMVWKDMRDRTEGKVGANNTTTILAIGIILIAIAAGLQIWLLLKIGSNLTTINESLSKVREVLGK